MVERERIHFVGIGGAGMSAIAKVLLERGARVSGSDIKLSRATTMLEALGATVRVGHFADAVEGVSVVVASSAIAPDNPEVKRARELSIPVVSRGEALARLLADSKAIVVAGTHGKTTTTSMIVALLRAARRDPTYLVGAGLNDSGTNAKHGRDDFAVAESDESDGSFLLLRPHVAVVTNVEADHLDHWESLAAIRVAFERFVASTSADGVVVVPRSDEDLAHAASSAGKRVVTFGPGGWAEAADVRFAGTESWFELRLDGESAPAHLRVPGAHNIENALAAAAAAYAVGVNLDDIAAGLGVYAGVERRFQPKGAARGVTIVDDYAHHPTEVAATLRAARLGEWRRLVAVFQPHRYSRTAALASDFGAAFAPADAIVVTDVYGAGERPVPGVSGKTIADAVCARLPGRPVAYLPHRDELVDYLTSNARPGDLVLTMGAGDVTTLGPALLERLERAQ